MGIFDRAANWIKGVLNKMLNKTIIKDKLGYEVSVSAEMSNALRLWSAMYAGKPSWVNKDIKTLGLPSAIANEIARAVTLEMEVTVEGGVRADYLNEQIQKAIPQMRQAVEYGVAKGGLIFKPYVSGDSILIDFIQADQFYPIEFDTDGRITGCVFIDKKTIVGNYYTRLEVHMTVENGVEIKNVAFKSESPHHLGTETQLQNIPVWKDIEPVATITGVDSPLFAYFKFPLANTIEAGSPLGVSCFSRAVGLIEQADRLWSSLLWEFESGERAVFIDELAFGKDDRGKPVLPNRRLYRTIDTGSQQSDFFKEWSPTYREQNILNGLDSVLKRIEFATGLAYGTISDPISVERTATEIVISRQRSYSTIVDTQKALQSAIEDLLVAMDTWATLFKLSAKGDYEATFAFDDSTVVDKATQLANDLQLVSAGLISKVEFRMRNFGEDEKTAEKALQKVSEESSFDDFGDEPEEEEEEEVKEETDKPKQKEVK